MRCQLVVISTSQRILNISLLSGFFFFLLVPFGWWVWVHCFWLFKMLPLFSMRSLCIAQYVIYVSILLVVLSVFIQFFIFFRMHVFVHVCVFGPYLYRFHFPLTPLWSALHICKQRFICTHRCTCRSVVHTHIEHAHLQHSDVYNQWTRQRKVDEPAFPASKMSHICLF